MKPLAFRRSLQEVPKGPEPPKDRRRKAAVWAAAKVGFSRLSVFVSPEPIAFRRWTFSAEIRRQVGEWIAEQPDLSLHELQSRLRDELRLRASIGRLWSLLRELGLRLKKSRSTPLSKTLPPADSDVLSGGNK